MRLKTVFILALISQLVSATTPEQCYLGFKDEAKGMHIVVENCSDIGSFSLGGLYDGNWEKLTYFYPKPWPGTFVTIKVNDKFYATSTQPANSTVMDAFVVEYPHAANGAVSMKWGLPENLVVEQSFQTVANGTSMIIKLSNEGSETLNTGVRIHFDTMIGVNDGAPIYIPGDGLRTSEKTYEGGSLNFKYWKAYNKQDEPTIIATGTIDPDSGLTYPDRVVVADWKKSKDTAWNYVTDGKSILGDSAVILYYNNIAIPSGESRAVVTNYGAAQPVLPAAKGTFGVTELLLDNVYGDYCPGETAKISVDVLAAKKSANGKIKMKILKDKKSVLEDEKPTGDVGADTVKTIAFDWEIPNQTASYGLSVTLLNGTNQEIDKLERPSFMKVDLKKCYPKEKKLRLWPLSLLLLVFAIALFMIIVKKRGQVTITKAVDNGLVKVTVKNNTGADIEGCIVEDKIPPQAELQTITIDVVRMENKLVWNIGVLGAGGEATLEYVVKGVHVLPRARVVWRGGEKSSD